MHRDVSQEMAVRLGSNILASSTIKKIRTGKSNKEKREPYSQRGTVDTKTNTTLVTSNTA